MLSYSYYLDGSGYTALRYADWIYFRPLEEIPKDAPSWQVGIHHLPECTLEEAIVTQYAYSIRNQDGAAAHLIRWTAALRFHKDKTRFLKSL